MADLKTVSVILSVCLFSLLVGQTVALRCYQCSSQSSSQTCGSSGDNGGSNEDNDDNDDDYVANNSTATTKGGCSACDIETKTHKNGKVMYKRRCLEGSAQKSVAGCRSEGVNEVCTTLCYTDLCNTGSTLQTGLLSLVSVLCAAVITKYRV